MKNSSLFNIFIALPVLIFMLGLPGAVMAKTGYVSDELVITMRGGKGSNFKIVDYLKSGTRLEVLQEGDTYLRVRTPEGKEGWVLRRYITSELPKSDVIKKLRNEVEGMKATVTDAESAVAERDKLIEENKRLQAENEITKQKLRRIERKDLLYWFLAGAGVLFLGWLIGRTSRQKRFY